MITTIVANMITMVVVDQTGDNDNGTDTGEAKQCGRTEYDHRAAETSSHNEMSYGDKTIGKCNLGHASRHTNKQTTNTKTHIQSNKNIKKQNTNKQHTKQKAQHNNNKAQPQKQNTTNTKQTNRKQNTTTKTTHTSKPKTKQTQQY